MHPQNQFRRFAMVICLQNICIASSRYINPKLFLLSTPLYAPPKFSCALLRYASQNLGVVFFSTGQNFGRTFFFLCSGNFGQEDRNNVVVEGKLEEKFEKLSKKIFKTCNMLVYVSCFILTPDCFFFHSGFERKLKKVKKMF